MIEIKLKARTGEAVEEDLSVESVDVINETLVILCRRKFEAPAPGGPRVLSDWYTLELSLEDLGEINNLVINSLTEAWVGDVQNTETGSDDAPESD